MDILPGVLAGLVWGALAALLNGAISKSCMKKNTATAMMAANTARMAVDIAALAAVFLLRRRLPFRYEAALIGTAIALSVVTIVVTFRLTRPK